MRACRIVAALGECSAFAFIAALACGACMPVPVPDAATDSAVEAASDAADIPIDAALPVVEVDLLVMVDNSNSMRDNQTELMSQLGAIVSSLTDPPCTSPSNETPHACNAMDPTDVPQHAPVGSMNVGVIDSDLGTPGSNVPGCSNPLSGDDGLLNPIRQGLALSMHEPWEGAPPSYGRPTSCEDPLQYPAFITYDAMMAAAMGAAYTGQFVTDFQCNAGLYVNGCGLESQLEAVWRALIFHDASDRPGNTDPNAGFMRSEALLAIVLLTDEEDTSVRNCTYANGMPCVTDHSDPNPLHQDALDVYNAASSNWSSPNLNLRCYMYQPGSAQDPAWPLERYIDPDDVAAGFPGLKPGHPERVTFAAITGVPLAGWQNSDGSTNWDALLGTEGPGGPNDYYNRNAGPGGAAINDPMSLLSPEGPISMYQASQDRGCSERTIPSCRRQGSTYPGLGMDCTTDLQYFAWPARRITEVARRFDQATFCPGGACGNGLVASICASNYTAATQSIAALIARRM